MIKYTIKEIVVLPLFIATLLTSFYVMQPQTVDAYHVYKDSGDDDGTPLASDAFDAIEDGDVATTHQQVGASSDGRIELELQQFIACQLGTAPLGTCQSIDMKGYQTTTRTGSPDVESDSFMLQKDDTRGQNNVDNHLTGRQTVNFNEGSGATVDISHNSLNNELNLNMYQYNKRAPIAESTADFEIDDIPAAVADESNGGGNDDTRNVHVGEQFFDAIATGTSVLQAATSGDLTFTLAQFNAGCDDTDDRTIDITCENQAVHDIDLVSKDNSRLTFNTLSPIEHQQINTCTFSNLLNCLSDGRIDVNVLTEERGQANVQLENPNGQPVLFQENTCGNLANAATSPTQQQCTNRSNNFFDVQSGIDYVPPPALDTVNDDSNIQKTNLDLQVAQANDCDSATAPIDCVNRGLTSTVVINPNKPNERDISDFGPANTIVTVSASGDSIIEDADPNSFLTMVNDCDGAKPLSSSTSGSSNCINEALNEAHFAAGPDPEVPSSTGGYIDVDSLTQQSTTENFCDNLDDDTCKNTARNTFTAQASNDGTININSDVIQTNDLENNCNEAECLNDAINAMLLSADDGATITASSSDLRQTNTLYNGCYSEADCDNLALNQFQATGGPGDIIISDLTQQISLSNTCYDSNLADADTISCSLKGQNLYTVTNTDPDADNALTISPYQSISLSCSGNTDCSKDQTNTFTYTKTTGSSLSFSTSQTSSSGAYDNSYINTSGQPPQQGSCQLTQSGTATTYNSQPTC